MDCSLAVSGLNSWASHSLTDIIAAHRSDLMDCCCCRLCTIQKCCILSFFSASGSSVRGVVFRCDETILDPPAFLHHLKITDILYLRISGRSSRITSVAKTFCKQVSPKLCNFFLPSQQDLVENTKMHGDARTTDN